MLKSVSNCAVYNKNHLCQYILIYCRFHLRKIGIEANIIFQLLYLFDYLIVLEKNSGRPTNSVCKCL